MLEPVAPLAVSAEAAAPAQVALLPLPPTARVVLPPTARSLAQAVVPAGPKMAAAEPAVQLPAPRRPQALRRVAAAQIEGPGQAARPEGALARAVAAVFVGQATPQEQQQAASARRAGFSTRRMPARWDVSRP